MNQNSNIQAQHPTHATGILWTANVISYVFHPILMPLVMTFVLHKLTPAGFSGVTDKTFYLWTVSVGMTTLFFPLFSIGLMKPLGFLKSLKMPTAQDRIIPLMISMIFYFWISHVFNSMQGANVPLILKVLFLGNFWGIILIFLVNIFTKISMHTAAAGGVIGNILVLMILSPVDMEIPLFVSLLIAGVIGTARLITGSHQRGDVWLGYIIGILVQLGAWVYFR